MNFEIVQTIKQIEALLERNPNTSEFDFLTGLVKELKAKLEDRDE